jgi:hypothetical protein
MRAATLILALLLTVAAGGAEDAGGDQCFVFWASQCFEIRDARTRDITHHVLITRGPSSLQRQNADCEARLKASLEADEKADLLEQFNDVLEDIDGCDTLETPPTRLYGNAEEAIRDYRRLTREGSRTKLHRLAPPRLKQSD